MPTLDEINAVSADTPVFVLHLYDRALLNAAALRVCGFTKDTPNPPGGEIQRDHEGNPTGLLIAKPNAMILYSSLAKGPKLTPEYQLNSTRQFMREMNRLGLTSAIDAGGGFQNYPEDYQIMDDLHRRGEMTVRVAYNLFTPASQAGIRGFRQVERHDSAGCRQRLLPHEWCRRDADFSAADFEDFLEPRPDLVAMLETELTRVVRLLAKERWALSGCTRPMMSRSHAS